MYIIGMALRFEYQTVFFTKKSCSILLFAYLHCIVRSAIYIYMKQFNVDMELSLIIAMR